MQTAVGNTTGYVNYVYNLQAKGTAQVASQIMGMSGLVGSTLGQLAFQTSAYLSEAESVAMSFGVVATAGLYKATKQALEFDYAMQGVQAIAGQNNIGNLGEQAMAMSNKFGVAIDQMIEGLESLARAGVSPSNMQGILEEAMGLSKLESIDLNTAINSLISTTNLLDTQDLDLESPEYVDAIKYQNQKITATSEAAPINAQDIIHTLEHVGGYASSTNLDQDDLYAVIAQLGSKGTKSEMAGTSLRAFLAAGQKDTAQRALARIGLSVSDLWKNDEQILSISDMKDVLDEAMEAKGYTKQEKLEFYSDFAGYKQANQIMKIDTKSVREFKEKIDQSWDVGKKIDTILQTTQANLQNILQTGTNLVTSVGQPLMHMANVILTPLKMVMGAIDFVVTKIPGMKWVTAGTLMMVALKGLSTVFNKVAPSVALMLDGFTGVRNYAQDTRDALAESATLIRLISATHNPFTNVDDQNKEFARGQLVDRQRKQILSNISDEDYLRYFINYKGMRRGGFSKQALIDMVELKKAGMNPIDREQMEQQIREDKKKRFEETGALYTEDKKSQAEILQEKNEILNELTQQVAGTNARFDDFIRELSKKNETKANSEGPDKVEKGFQDINKAIQDRILPEFTTIQNKQGDILSDTSEIVSTLSSLTDNVYTVRLSNDSTIRFDSDNNINFDLDLSTINNTLEKGFANVINAIKGETSNNASTASNVSSRTPRPKVIKTKSEPASVRIEDPIQNLEAIEDPDYFYVPKKGHGDALIKRLRKAKGKDKKKIRQQISARIKEMKKIAKEIERQDKNDNLLGSTLQEYWELRNQVFGDERSFVEYGELDENGVFFKELPRSIDKKVRNTYGVNKIATTKDKRLLKQTANVQVKVKVVSDPNDWDIPDISDFTANNDPNNTLEGWADYLQQQLEEEKNIEKNIPIEPTYILPTFNGPKISDIPRLKGDRTIALSKVTNWLQKVDKDLQTMKNQFEDDAEYEKFVAEQYYRALDTIDAYNITALAEAGFLTENPEKISAHRMGTVQDYIHEFYKFQKTVRKSGRFNEHDPKQMIYGAERFGDIRNEGSKGAARYFEPSKVEYTDDDLGTYDELNYGANNYERTKGVVQDHNKPKFMRIVYDNEARTVGNYIHTRANDMNAEYGAMDIIPEPMHVQVAEGTDDTVYSLAQDFQDKLTFYQQKGGETHLPVGSNGKILAKEQIEARIKNLENKAEVKTVQMANLIDKNIPQPIETSKLEKMVDEDFSKDFILDFTQTLLDSNYKPLTSVKIVNTNGEDEILDTRMNTDSPVSIHNQFKKLLIGSPEYMEAVSNKMNKFLADNSVRNLLKTGQEVGDQTIVDVLKNMDEVDKTMVSKDLLTTVYRLYKSGTLDDEVAGIAQTRARTAYKKAQESRQQREANFSREVSDRAYDYTQDEDVEENMMTDTYSAKYEYFQDQSSRMDPAITGVDNTIINGLEEADTKTRVDNFTGALKDSLQAIPNATKVDMVHQEAEYGNEMSSLAEQIAELDRQHKMVVEMEGLVEKGQIPGVTDVANVTDKDIRKVYGNLIKSPWSNQYLTGGTVEGKNQKFGDAEDVMTSIREAQAVYDSFKNRTDVLKSYEGIHRSDINDDTNYLPNVVRKRSLESVQRSSRLPDFITAAKATPGAGGEEEGWRRMFMETEHGIVSYIDKNEMSIEIPGGKVHPDKLKPADQLRVASTYLGEQATKYLNLTNLLQDKFEYIEELKKRYYSGESNIDVIKFEEEMNELTQEFYNLIQQRNKLNQKVLQDTKGVFDFDDESSNDLERALDLGEGRGVEVLPEVFVRTSGRYFEKNNGDPFIRDEDGQIIGIERDANNRFAEIWTKELEKKRYSERLKSKNKLNAGFLAGNFGFTQKDITEIQLPERAQKRIAKEFNEQAFLGIDYKKYEEDEDYRKEIDGMYKRMNIMNYKPVGAPKDAKPNKNLFKRKVDRNELRYLQEQNLLLPQDIARYITDDNRLKNEDRDGLYEIFDLGLLQYSKEDMYNAATMELISKDLMLQRNLASVYNDRNPYTNELYKGLTLDDVFAVDFDTQTIRTTNKVSPFIAQVMDKGMFAKEGGFALKKFLDKGGNEDRFLANMVNNLDLTEELRNASLKRMEEIKAKREKFLAGAALAQNKLYHGQTINNDDLYYLSNMDVMQNVYETEMGIEEELQKKFNYIQDLAFVREQYVNDPKYIQQLEEAGILNNYSGYDNLQDYIEKTSVEHENQIQYETVANNPLEKERRRIDTAVSDEIWKDFDNFLLKTGSFEEGFGSMFFNEKHFRNLTSLDAFKDFMINEKMHYNRKKNEEDPEKAIKEFFASNSDEMQKMLFSAFQVYAQQDTSWQRYMDIDEYFALWLQNQAFGDEFDQLFFLYQHYNKMQHIYDQTGTIPDIIAKSVKDRIEKENKEEAEQEKWRYSTFVSSYKPQPKTESKSSTSDIDEESIIQDTYKFLDSIGVTDEDLYNNAQSLPGIGLLYAAGKFQERKMSESKYKVDTKNASAGDLRLAKDSNIWAEPEEGTKQFDVDRLNYLQTLDEISRLYREYSTLQRKHLDASANVIKARIEMLENSIQEIQDLEQEEKNGEKGPKSFGEISAENLQKRALEIRDAQSRIADLVESSNVSLTTEKGPKDPTKLLKEKIETMEKFTGEFVTDEILDLQKKRKKESSVGKIKIDEQIMFLKLPLIANKIQEAADKRDEIIDEYFSQSWDEVLDETYATHSAIYGDLKNSNPELFNKEVMAQAQETFMSNTLKGLKAFEAVTPFLEDFNPMEYLEYIFGNNLSDYVAFEKYVMSSDEFNAISSHSPLKKFSSYSDYYKHMQNNMSDFEKARHGLYDIGQHERKQREAGTTVNDGSGARVRVIFGNDEEEKKETQSSTKNSTRNSYKNATYLGRAIYTSTSSTSTSTDENKTSEEKLQDEMNDRRRNTDEYKNIEESLKRYKQTLDTFFVTATKEIFGQYENGTFKLSDLFNNFEYNTQSEKLENASNALGNNIMQLSKWRDALDMIGQDYTLLRAPIDMITMALTPILAVLQTGHSVTNLLLSVTEHAKNLATKNKTTINGRSISADSGTGQIIGAVGGLIGPVGDKIDDFVLKNIAPIIPELAAIGVAIYGVKSALDLSYKSHKKYLEQVQEEDKQNRSRSKSLQALVKQSKERVMHNKAERQQDSLNRQYMLNKRRLDNANLTRTSGAINLSNAQNDALWGQYGISAALNKIQGKYESTAENYDGSTGQIRRIKESTVGGQGLFRGLPGYFSPAQEQVAAYYDANQLALGRLDEYIDELGQLYDTETTTMLKYHSTDVRGTPEFQKALNDFVEATGITKEHAQKYLDYMQTEHNVDKASQAMQAQADTIASNTEFKIQAIAFGGNPADVLGLNGVEAQQNAMIQAQADIIQLELSSQLWWKAVWSTITSPVRALISPIFAIAHTLSAIWSVITGNWNAAGRHMQQAGASLNVLGETTTYWSAWGEVESTDFNAIGQEAVDDHNRANYGNVGAAPKTGYVNAKNPESNAIFGMFPVGPKGGVHWGKEHKETLAQTKQESFFSKLIGTVTGLLGTIVSILTIGAVGLGIKTLWDHSDTLKNWVGKLTGYFPNIRSTIEKIPGATTIGKYGGKFIDYLKGTRMGQFVSSHIPDSWKERWQSFKDLWNKDVEDISEEEVTEDKPIEENVSSISENVQNIWNWIQNIQNNDFFGISNTLNPDVQKVLLERYLSTSNNVNEIVDAKKHDLRQLLSIPITNVNLDEAPEGTENFMAYTSANMTDLTFVSDNMLKGIKEGRSTITHAFFHELAHNAMDHYNPSAHPVSYFEDKKYDWHSKVSEYEAELISQGVQKRLGMEVYGHDLEKMKANLAQTGRLDQVDMERVNSSIDFMVDNAGPLLDNLVAFVKRHKNIYGKDIYKSVFKEAHKAKGFFGYQMEEKRENQDSDDDSIDSVKDKLANFINNIGEPSLTRGERTAQHDFIYGNPTLFDMHNWTGEWGEDFASDMKRAYYMFTHEGSFSNYLFSGEVSPSDIFRNETSLMSGENHPITYGAATDALQAAINKSEGLWEDSILYHGGGLIKTNQGSHIGNIHKIMSTSFNKETAEGFLDKNPNPYLTKIYAPQGTAGLYTDSMGEDEWTLDEGTKFVELSRDDDKKEVEILLLTPSLMSNLGLTDEMIDQAIDQGFDFKEIIKKQSVNTTKNMAQPLPEPVAQPLLGSTIEDTVSAGIETLPIVSMLPAHTKTSWSEYLSEKVHGFTDPWSNYLTQKKNSLLGISNEDIDTFNKKKRKGMNKEERAYLNEKYDLGFDLDNDFRTANQANKAIRNKLDETGQWDAAVQDLHGGGLYRHQIKENIKNNYVEPWKEYGHNKVSQWMTEAELYNQNPTYMGKQIYDTKNAPLPVKMIAKGYEIKDKIASKIGLGDTGSFGELRQALQDPELMEQYLKDRLDSFDSDSTIGRYRDKAYRAKEIISDPEKTMEWIQGKYYNGLDKGKGEYERYNQGAVSYGDLSIPNKIRHMKEQVLGMSGDESFADLLQDPERTVEVAKRGYVAFKENGLNGLLGADDDYDIAGSMKDKVAEMFGKIKEGAEEGIDDEDGGEGGSGGLIQKAKEKLAGIFGNDDKDTSPITKEEMEENAKEGNFQTVSDWKKQKLEEIQKPSLSERIKEKLGFGTDEEDMPSLSDWKKDKVEEAQSNKKESLSNRISNKMKNIFGSEDQPMSRIGRMTTLPEGQTPMSEMVKKVVSPGAAEEAPSILDLDDAGELLNGKNLSKGGKGLSKIGGKLAGKGGKLGKIGKGMSKVGGGLSKAGSKGVGKLAKTGIGKIGGKLMSKVGGKIAGKVGAQVASKVLGGALMATGIGAPLGLLLESPIGGMLMEGVMNLGGSLLGGATKSIGRGARGLSRALGFGRALPGEHGGIGGAIGKAAIGGIPILGGLAAGAGNMVKGLFGGGSKNQAKASLKPHEVKAGQNAMQMSKSLKNIDKSSDITSQHNEKIAGKTQGILEKIKKDNNQQSSGGNITIQNININTADDPEAIKEMFLELLVELQEQVNPRLVSRTAGQASSSETTTDTSSTENTNTSTGTEQNNSTNQNTNSTQ